METITLDVKGMSCQGCVGSVTRVLKGTPGVQDVQVTLQPGRANVTFDPAHINAAQLRQAIEDAGYGVG
jgi:copper ion binding protein